MLKMVNWREMNRELKTDEGFEECIYTCTAGKLTLGYGFNVEDEPIPEHIASIWLDWLIMKRHEDLSQWQWYCELDDFRKRIMINMAFNLGTNGLLNFKKMINAIIDKDYDLAADEMEDSRWFEQVGDRSKRLVKMMRDGE